MEIKNKKDFVKDCLSKKNKLIDCSWQDIVDKYELDCHPDSIRKWTDGMKIYSDILEENESTSTSDNETLIEIKKQKIQLTDLRTNVNAKIRDLARTENVIDLMKNEIKELSNNKSFFNDYENISVGQNDMILCLGDWHYGIEINNAVNKYNTGICKERLNKLSDKVIQYGKENNIDKLYIACLGDLVSGEIHNTIKLDNQESVAKQVIQVSEILAQLVNKLAKHFYCVLSIIQGNHDAIDMNKSDRLNRNNYTKLIKEIVRVRLDQLDNVLILDNEFNDGEVSCFNVKGLTVATCHGDKIDKLKAKQQLEMVVGKPVQLILYGHVHNPQHYEINETSVYVIGSLSGTDEYAMNRKLYTVPSQTILLVDDEGIKCSYDIKL